MKLLRICYGVALLALYLLGRVSGHREYFLLLFTLLFVLLAALALNLWTLLSFSYLQEVSEPTSVKGRERRLRIGIYNDKPFPLTMMRIQVETVSPRENTVLSFNLPPRESVHFDIPLHCPYRGLFRVGMTRVEMNDIFGLLRLSYDMRSLPYYRQRELKIYPRVVDLPMLPSPAQDTKLPKGGRLRTAESGDSYDQLRAYRLGDPGKRIHWKQSARSGKLLVKQYEVPMETGVLLAIDRLPEGLEGERALQYADLACECAAAIAMYSLRAGHAVELLDADPDHRAVEASAPEQYAIVSEWLTVLPFPCVGDLSRRLYGSRRRCGEDRTVYVLTHRPDSALQKELIRLQGLGGRATCLILAPELTGAAESLPGIPCLGIPVGGDLADLLGGAL